MPKTAEKLAPFYFTKGEKKGSYIYLPKDIRFRLLEKVGCLAEKYGMKFGTCRDELAHLNTATCDGSWLLDNHR
jgi:hypothetical protein